MQNVLESLGRCGSSERRRISCVRRHCESVRIWKSFSFDLKDLRGKLEDVGELMVFYREGVLAAEIHQEDGAGRGIGRVHGILLRRDGEQRGDHSKQVGGDQFYREQFLWLAVPMSNPLSISVRQCIKRAHVEMGSQQNGRRPLTWGVLTGMQESVQAWGLAGRVLRIGLVLSYLFML